MKRHIKKIITVALCMSIMQPTLQATPFGEFTRKWVARGAAVGYWGILGNQVLNVRENYLNTIELIENIESKSISDESSIFPDLKDYAPRKAADINACLEKEGIKGLDGYSIKVVTDDGIKKLALEFMLNIIRNPNLRTARVVADLQLQINTVRALQRHGSPANFGETIVVPADYVHDCDVPTLAASLAHEREHGIKKHTNAKAALLVAAPFAIHAGCKGIYNAVFGANKTQPTITRSLLRIPRAGAIVGVSCLVQQIYSRECEREADKAVQLSPLLSRSLAHGLYEQADEKSLEPLLARNWENLNKGGLGIILYVPFRNINDSLDKCLATNMIKTQYVPFMKYVIGILSSHPWPSERVAYLEKWAKEAEAKKQQASAKED